MIATAACSARRVLLGLLLGMSLANAAIVELGGRTTVGVLPPVSVGAGVDIGVILKNNGASTVTLTGTATTGPFTVISSTCGPTLSAGAVCSGSIVVRFSPTAVGAASGTLVVRNDSPEGALTLALTGTGTALLPPTLAASFAPASIYPVTGVTTLTLTLANPNNVPLTPTFFNLNLPTGFQTTPYPNISNQCGGGAWTAPNNGSLAGQRVLTFAATTALAPLIPAKGSCLLSVDLMSTNGPGVFSFQLDLFLTAEVWSATPAASSLTLLAPTPGAPGAPTLVSVVRGNGQVTVNFSAPSSSGSSAITGYTVVSKPSGGVDAQAGTTGLSHTVTGLANGTSYTFAVIATNAAGASPPSTPSAPVVPATVPGAPLTPVATAGNGQALVTFSAPLNNGGEAITGYAVASSPSGGVDANAGGNGHSHLISGLVNGTAYTFTVVATNALGAGAPSLPSTAIAPTASVAKPAPVQVTYQVAPKRSAIAASTPVVPQAIGVKPEAYLYSGPRDFGYADFNGDGLIDIFTSPAYSQHKPFVPVEVWLNNGDNTFRNGTAEVFDGNPPLTRNVTDLFIADFNGDGRPDVLMIDSGIEFAVANGDPDSGARNTLVLSQANGKLRDATGQLTPNPQVYNHMGGVGDFNGDGYLDAVANRFPSTSVDSSGVAILLNDGNGNLRETSEGLSQDMAFMPSALRRSIDYQSTGCVALVDLDGDGRADLVTGSYSAPDGTPPNTTTRTIRFHQSLSDGTAIERGRVAIPSVLASIPSLDHPGGFFGLGCSQILPADLNGDGRPDLIVQWEGNGGYIQILRNDGNFQFTDITVEALGSYSATFNDDGALTSPGKVKLLDLNGDGALDIVYAFNPTTLSTILGRVALLNDGNAHFTAWTPQAPGGKMTAADILVTSACTSCSYLPMFTAMTPGAMPSLLVMDFQSDRTLDANPIQTKTIFLTAMTPVAMPTVSSSPKVVRATAADGQAVISFTAPEFSGGSAITGYTVRSSRGDGVDQQAGTTAASHVVTGLINGQTYTFTVTAKNATGTSLPSAPSKSVTPVAKAQLSLSVAALDFGGQSMNTTTPPQTVAITNTGGEILNISSVSASASFSVSHDCTSLAAGMSCSARVTFTPSTATTLSGALTIQSSTSTGTVSLAGTGERSLVTHYYRSILRRAPDSGGKAFWEAEATRVQALGASVNEVWFVLAQNFYFSLEYIAQNRDNAGFVTDLYATFFNRSPDTAGRDYWVGQIVGGLPREVVLLGFMLGPEFTTFTQAIFGTPNVRKEVDTVVDFYRGLLGRLPDVGGFNYWVGQFRSAQCQGGPQVNAQVEAISSAYANSSEYLARNRSNTLYVSDLYNAFLRRAGDLPGVLFWISQISTSARTRENVRQQFIQTPEFQARVAAIIQQGCLQ